jgi:hypothetical protein
VGGWGGGAWFFSFVHADRCGRLMFGAKKRPFLNGNVRDKNRDLGGYCTFKHRFFGINVNH